MHGLFRWGVPGASGGKKREVGAAGFVSFGNLSGSLSVNFFGGLVCLLLKYLCLSQNFSSFFYFISVIDRKFAFLSLRYLCLSQSFSQCLNFIFVVGHGLIQFLLLGKYPAEICFNFSVVRFFQNDSCLPGG